MRKHIILLSLLVLAACEPQSRGFNLPPGNAESGKAAFLLLQCNDCHSVADGSVSWAGENREEPIHVVLGGKTTQVRTYGDLVTSIIHPSHRISGGHNPETTTPTGESKMRTYNEVMSVQELIDLVEFLQGKYEVWVPDYYTYAY